VRYPIQKWDVDTKNLFPLDWTEEDIAEAFVKVEEKIKDVLTKEYGLPEYAPEYAGKYWKNVNLDSAWKSIPVKTIINVNWKKIELEIWWKYNNEWKLDFTIQTIYPSN
jgi:hypothetical protein